MRNSSRNTTWRAVVFGQQAFFTQFAHDHRQVGVVGGFAARVGAGEADAQLAVHRFAVGQRHVNKLLPQRQHFGVAGLQAHHIVAGAVGKGGVFVKADFGLAVKVFQVVQRQAGVLIVAFHQIGGEHAKLGAPVAHMVAADGVVADGGQHAHQRVADDAGAQVADVHFLGQVGRGVIDNHLLARALRFDAQRGAGQRGADLAGQKDRVEVDVDKAGAGNFDFAGDAGQVQLGNYLLGQRARVGFFGLGGGHDAVGLIVAKLGARGGLQDGRGVRAASGGQGGRNALVEQLQKGHGVSLPGAPHGKAGARGGVKEWRYFKRGGREASMLPGKPARQ